MISQKEILEEMEWKDVLHKTSDDHPIIRADVFLNKKRYICFVEGTVAFNFRVYTENEYYGVNNDVKDPDAQSFEEGQRENLGSAIEGCVQAIIKHYSCTIPLSKRANHYIEKKTGKRTTVVPLTVGQPLIPIVLNSQEMAAAYPLQSPMPQMEE